MPVEISLRPVGVEEALKRLKDVPWGVQKAVYPALAEVLSGAKKELSRRLVADVPIKAGMITRAIKATSPAVQGGMVSAVLSVRSRKLPLIAYDVQPDAITAAPGVPRAGRSSFTYALRRGQRRAAHDLRLESAAASDPFIARMKSGHKGVFHRTGKGNEIKENYGPAVQYHAANPAVESDITDYLLTAFPPVLARYVEATLEKEAAL